MKLQFRHLPLGVLLALGFPFTGFAQLAPTPAVPVPPAAPAVSTEVVELSPFTVNSTADKGYRAENTLAGSRLNTSLRDTPASISVFTREFLDDIGLNEIEKLIDYSVNSQINTQDVNSGPNANNMLGGANVIQRINVRASSRPRASIISRASRSTTGIGSIDTTTAADPTASSSGSAMPAASSTRVPCSRRLTARAVA